MRLASHKNARLIAYVHFQIQHIPLLVFSTGISAEKDFSKDKRKIVKSPDKYQLVTFPSIFAFFPLISTLLDRIVRERRVLITNFRRIMTRSSERCS